MKLLVAITGASGAIYGIRLLEALKKLGVCETHLIVSRWGERTLVEETGRTTESLRNLASACHDVDDLAAPPSSGSFRHDGMIVAPCSMRTLAAIAHGLSANLIHRAADVALKERRRLVLMTRETPLSQVHLENMLKVSRAGAIVAPPTPAFYTKPQALEEIVEGTVTRLLDLVGIDLPGAKRWGDA